MMTEEDGSKVEESAVKHEKIFLGEVRGCATQAPCPKPSDAEWHPCLHSTVRPARASTSYAAAGAHHAQE